MGVLNTKSPFVLVSYKTNNERFHSFIYLFIHYALPVYTILPTITAHIQHRNSQWKIVKIEN